MFALEVRLFTVLSIAFALMSSLPRGSAASAAEVEADSGTNAFQRMPGKFIAPHISELGVPVAFSRDSTAGHDSYFEGLWRRHGLPFDLSDRPYGLEVGVWSSGAVIWVDASDPARPIHYEGQIEPAKVRELMASIDVKKYSTADNLHYSALARTDCYLPSTVLAFLKHQDAMFLYSFAGNENLLHEYFYWEKGNFETYPMNEYSLEEFKKKVPPAFRRYYHDNSHLRDLLRSVVPEKGKKIVLHERIRWVVLSYANPTCKEEPSSGGATDHPKGREHGP